MPRAIRALSLLAALAAPVAGRAADLRAFDDAPLHAVQFVDRQEGWAVGDDGVVWHTTDGGGQWERQPTGCRASLRAIHFVNPYTGWVVGREELPHGAGSVGVVLATVDGGLKWTRLATNAVPGLNCVRFFDDRNGLAAGDSSGRFTTGVFATADGGRTWKALPGPRCPGWPAADFSDPRTGALAGAWGRLATLRNGLFGVADVDTLAGRSMHALRLNGPKAVAVGDGGAVLTSADSAGARWGFADLGLPDEVLAACDFHAVCTLDRHVWVVGRPGSVVLHSADDGRRWEMLPTGQTLPLHGVCFIDRDNGWAVGELGTILASTDGGKTWKEQRKQAGKRAAVLFLHASAAAMPFDTVALLGGSDGYLTAAVRVTAPDPATADPCLAAEDQRLRAAVRRCGGAAGEAMWQFPLPQHLAGLTPKQLLAHWGPMHGDRAAEQMLRQLVLALRVWQPEVVVTDAADPNDPAAALVAEAAREAFARAADPRCFPEQIDPLRLKPWQGKKLYAVAPTRAGAQITLELTDARPLLADTPRALAADAADLLRDRTEAGPAQRFYRLLASPLADAARHTELMQGIDLAFRGTARRAQPLLSPAEEDAAAELVKSIRASRNLQELLAPKAGGLAKPEQVLQLLGPTLAKLPPDQGASAAFAVANQLARSGQWVLAREAFLGMVDRYPAHPLSADAYRWLVRYQSSSEARRRQELGQFVVSTLTEFKGTPPPEGSKGEPATIQPVTFERVTTLSSMEGARRWYEGSLAVEPRLAAFGPLFATDPTVQFSLQASRRQLGEAERSSLWFTRFLADGAAPDARKGDAWREAAAAELWLNERTGTPPRPVAACRQTALRPFLDGRLDDTCWQNLQPLRFQNARGDGEPDKQFLKEYPTKAWFAYDSEYLYVAVQCEHPAGQQVPAAKVRGRDDDLRPYDRVSILLDLDRDYQTYYHLQIDQRGCLAEDCWGDKGWNPRWFVAVSSTPTGWTAEAAIPMTELTGEKISHGKAWACNVTRVLPGRGVQGFSRPTDVRPRPEGMGLLIFTPEATRK